MNDRRPPQWPLAFLRFICKASVIEEIEGDLIELFELRAEKSPKRARLRLLWDAFCSVRWINLKKPKFMTSGVMLKNYLLVGYRSLRKDYRFSLLNSLGLCLGLSVFVVMMLMVRHEYSFDNFHEKSDRIFEVIQLYQQPDGLDPEIWTSALLSDAIETEIPYVERSVSLFGAASNWVEVNGKRFFEEEGIIADEDFFRIFDFPLEMGDPQVALHSPRSTVISQSLATKYFADRNPIGQVIDHEFYGAFTVTGVLEDVPANSYIQFDYIISPDFDEYFNHVASWFPRWFQSWRGDPAATYVLLEDASWAPDFRQDADQLLKKHLEADQVNPHYLVNMGDLHFGSNGIDGRINYYVKGDEEQVQLFTLVALLILLMACVNYINITTARSIKRHKEVGIRKTVGALRIQLISQFLVESFLLVLVSVLLAIGLAYWILPYFRLVTEINLTWSWERLEELVPYLLVTLFGVTLLAGFYPAIILSYSKTLQALKGDKAKQGRAAGVRNILLMAQFGLVLFMACGFMIIRQQYQFMTDKPLGFETKETVVVEINSGEVRENYKTLKAELLRIPGVRSVTGVSRMFNGYRSPTSVNAGLIAEDPELLPMKFYGMDEDGLASLGMELLSGTNFQGSFTLDSASVLINESAAAALQGDPLNQWIDIETSDDEVFRAKVIGVIKDFHWESLHRPISPIIIGYYINPIIGLDDIAIKIAGTNANHALESIEEVHNRYDTNDVMTWEFLDDMTQRAYEDELKFRRVFGGAALVSFVIALLGLVGLIAYSSAARTKEFGIRKVMGATAWDIFGLQSRSFLRFIGFASLFTIPICWWASAGWLRNYAYTIDLTPVPFLAVLLGIVTTTLVTAYLMGRGVARQNPVESLRYE